MSHTTNSELSRGSSIVNLDELSIVERQHARLFTQPLKWFKIRYGLFGAEFNDDKYLVAKIHNIYWSAGVNYSTDRIILGEEFMNRWEAMEVCEAWAYARARPRALNN